MKTNPANATPWGSYAEFRASIEPELAARRVREPGEGEAGTVLNSRAKGRKRSRPTRQHKRRRREGYHRKF